MVDMSPAAAAEWQRRFVAAYDDPTPLEPLFTRWKRPPSKLTDREIFIEMNEDLRSPWPVAAKRYQVVMAEVERRRAHFAATWQAREKWQGETEEASA